MFTGLWEVCIVVFGGSILKGFGLMDGTVPTCDGIGKLTVLGGGAVIGVVAGG